MLGLWTLEPGSDRSDPGLVRRSSPALFWTGTELTCSVLNCIKAAEVHVVFRGFNVSAAGITRSDYCLRTWVKTLISDALIGQHVHFLLMDTQKQLALACAPHSVFPWESKPLDPPTHTHTHILINTVEEADFRSHTHTHTHYQYLISASSLQKIPNWSKLTNNKVQISQL